MRRERYGSTAVMQTETVKEQRGNRRNPESRIPNPETTLDDMTALCSDMDNSHPGLDNSLMHQTHFKKKREWRICALPHLDFPREHTL
jgi:hypothetical protein